MSGVAIEIAVILLLLVINGVFSMSEMALVSARKTRLERRAEEGDAGARAALDLASHPTNFLSTVQVGITLVGVLAGAFGGAGISQAIAAGLRGTPWLGRYAEPVAFGLVVAAITYLSLIIGELVPKQLALGNPERVASLVARPMRVVATIGGPLVRFLTGSTNLVFRVLGIRATVEAGVTEHDIRAMVEQGAEAGALQPAEHEIVENTFRLGDRRVSTIMTPRLDVPWIDAGAAPDEIRAQLAEARWSPFLVCDGDVEHVLGLATAEDLLARALGGESLELRGVLREPLFVPASMPVLRLLEQFRSTRRRAAVVLDEFGGVTGLVTVGDILEALVGALPEPGDATLPEIAPQPDGTWLVEGSAAVTDLEAAVDIELPDDEARRGFDTVGGLVMSVLGRLPVVGDAFDYGDARFTVERLDGRRIESVRMHVRRPEA
jgi:putative hemolysin